MDIFVEPVLPRPEIVVCGSSPVAVAVADLGRRLGFAMTVCAPAAEQAAFADAERRIEALPCRSTREGTRFIVVSTQSRGDEAALQAALSVDADYVAFVGSRRKAETLRAKLRARRRSGTHRGAEGAGGPRPWCDHARGDRALHPRRDRGAPPQGPAGDAEPVMSLLDIGSTRRIRGPVSAAGDFRRAGSLRQGACFRQRRCCSSSPSAAWRPGSRSI